MLRAKNRLMRCAQPASRRLLLRKTAILTQNVARATGSTSVQQTRQTRQWKLKNYVRIYPTKNVTHTCVCTYISKTKESGDGDRIQMTQRQEHVVYTYLLKRSRRLLHGPGTSRLCRYANTCILLLVDVGYRTGSFDIWQHRTYDTICWCCRRRRRRRCCCLHIKPFFLPNDISPTPSVLTDSSC